MFSARSLRLSLLPETLAVCRLPLDSDLQMWFLGDPFFAMLRKGNDLTIVTERILKKKRDRIAANVGLAASRCSTLAFARLA